MVDLEQARTLIELRTGDRSGCLPVCSLGSVCKSSLRGSSATRVRVDSLQESFEMPELLLNEGISNHSLCLGRQGEGSSVG